MDALDSEILLFSLFPDITLDRNDSEYQMFSKYFDIINKEDFMAQMRMFENIGDKNIDKAKNFRSYGNEYFNDKEYVKALDSFNKSISYAPRDSVEFGLAVANRSIVLFKMEKYKECLDDINVVLKSEYPKDLLYKIFLRQSKCYLKLNLKSEVAKSLKRAQESADKMEGSNKEQRNSINDTIKELKKESIELLDSCVPENIPDEYEIKDPTLKDGENLKFLNASKIINIKYTKKLGRHVVANTDIEKGDVLFIEEPYSYVPLLKTMNTYKICACCLNTTSNYIPCVTCAVYIYCSDNCRQNAWDSGHRWECFGSRHGFVNAQKLGLSLLFNATRDGFLTDVDDNSVYGSRDNNYPFVNKLVTNKNKTEENFLNLYTKWAVWLVLYLKNFTDYFDWLNLRPIRPEGTKEELLKVVGGLLVKYFLQTRNNFVYIQDRQVVWDTQSFASISRVISGNGIYISSSLLNHSCIPNSADSFSGTTRVIRATKDIKKGTEITINYILSEKRDDISGKRVEERKAILARYSFECSCQLCIDPKCQTFLFDACYLCPRCSGRAKINNIIGNCTNCELTFNALVYTKIKQQIQDLHMKLQLFGDYNNQLDIMDKLMKKINYKHSHHFSYYYYMKIKLFYGKGEMKKCVDMAKLRMEINENIFECTSGEYILPIVFCAVILAKYSKTLKNQKSKLYKKYLNETKGMIKKCIDVLEYTVSTDNIKQFVTRMTEYLNSDDDNDFVIEKTKLTYF